MIDDGGIGTPHHHQQHSSSIEVSELGNSILQEARLADPLLHFVLSPLSLPDSGNSITAARILEA